MSVKVEFEGELPQHPIEQILMLEALARGLSQSIDKDPAYGTMLLLTAAAHVTMRYAKHHVDIEGTLAEILGSAIRAARGLFGNEEATSEGETIN